MPPKAQKTNPPTKKLTKAKSTVAPRLTAELISLKTQYVKSQYPGELSGNAVVLGLRLTNGTSKTVDLGNVVVNVTQANGNPASQITSSPAKALPTTAKSGATANGVFVFTVPKNQRNPITVSVTLSADTTVAVFKGKA